ncbi:MAG: hypothetical protein RL094_579 [Candidatus Parcubacteria bacterium]|jgi:hypothetical protein
MAFPNKHIQLTVCKSKKHSYFYYGYKLYIYPIYQFSHATIYQFNPLYNWLNSACKTPIRRYTTTEAPLHRPPLSGAIARFLASEEKATAQMVAFLYASDVCIEYSCTSSLACDLTIASKEGEDWHTPIRTACRLFESPL